MEAFPTMTLLSADAVLKSAVPAQLLHVSGTACQLAADWPAFLDSLSISAPALALLDSASLPEILPQLPALREAHPLMALLGIGTAAQEAAFAAQPLAAFIRKPVAMPALLHQLAQLAAERSIRAGQQHLALGMDASFRPAEKRIRMAAGDSIELTDKENALLACLYHHRHGWLPRQQLLEEVWGYGDGISTHTLETHLYRLRAKLREAFGEQELIATRQGSYRLQMPDAA